MAVPCSGCRDGTARSPQGFLPNPHFQCLPHSVFLAFWLLLPVELPESSQHRLWHLCIARLLLRRALCKLVTNTRSIPFQPLLQFSCLHFLFTSRMPRFPGLPPVPCDSLLKFLIESSCKGGEVYAVFSIYVRHFTLAFRTIFLSLHGLELLI